MKNSTHKRAEKIGGFHWIIRRAGEFLTIEHNGEAIRLQFNGNNGTNQWHMSLNGPKSFLIKRDSPTTTKLNGES